jgi:hypothetical protein
VRTSWISENCLTDSSSRQVWGTFRPIGGCIVWPSIRPVLHLVFVLNNALGSPACFQGHRRCPSPTAHHRSVRQTLARLPASEAEHHEVAVIAAQRVRERRRRRLRPQRSRLFGADSRKLGLVESPAILNKLAPLFGQGSLEAPLVPATRRRRASRARRTGSGRSLPLRSSLT